MGNNYPPPIRFRLTEAQLKDLKQDADDAGMKLSPYIRARVCGHHVKCKVDAKTVRELNRVVGLFKHTLDELRQNPDDPGRKLFGEIQSTLRNVLAAADAIRASLRASQ